MTNEMNSFIDQAIQNLEVPTSIEITNEAINQFKRGMDKTNEYRGHPHELLDGLDEFEKTGCLPLFYGGLAYIQCVGSYIEGMRFDADGLRSAEGWLAKALEIKDDLPELMVVQAMININSGNLGTASDLLDRIDQVSSNNFYAITARMDYYAMRNNKAQMASMHHKALPLAMTTSRRAYLQHRVGRYYLRFKMVDQSIECYTDLVKLTPLDPWMWHNLSIAYLLEGMLINAWKSNRMALKIMDFGNARDIKKSIQKRIFLQIAKYIFYVILAVIVVSNR
ncbi:MAG: hypothetical protein OEZ02_05490 [Anaerolineae bacterium]|nr:hypothetical protein [Anaerolineae bacterium]